MTAVRLDHAVIHVSDWERSNAFYADVVGAEIIPRGPGFAYRLGEQQLNCHGPGVIAAPLKIPPVRKMRPDEHRVEHEYDYDEHADHEAAFIRAQLGEILFHSDSSSVRSSSRPKFQSAWLP